MMWLGRRLRADQAIEKYGVSGKGVIVAILDRGIDWTHPDFIRRRRENPNQMAA